ncbi:MAG: hypothetical protein ACRC0L_12305, partial [Angustibacter sp.]
MRITTLYSLSPGESGAPESLPELADVLRFGRLTDHYRTGASQLPRPRHCANIDHRLGFTRWEGEIKTARLWLFQDPAQGIVAALTVNVDCSHKETIPLLEDLYYADFFVGDHVFGSWLNLDPAIPLTSVDIGPERHQLIFAAANEDDDRASADTIQRLIYRADLPARENTSCITYPGELNRRPSTLGALGPYVSVLIGQQDYLENSCLISAVHLVGAHA